jgi:hypothetical protein
MLEYIKKTFINIIEFFISAVAEKNDMQNGFGYRYKLSLGRSSWIAWFYATIYFTFNGIILSYLWYLVGLSCLGYVIGSKYIITNIGGASRTEIATWDNEEHV